MKCHNCETEITEKAFIMVNGKKLFRCPKCMTVVEDNKEVNNVE